MSNQVTFQRSPQLLSRSDSALLVVDMQDVLLNLMAEQDTILWNTRRLADAAQLLGVPVAVTEQYPQGLGPTNSELTSRLPEAVAKRAFSCCEAGELFESWVANGIRKIVVCGIEAHVCVLQTVLDLVGAGFLVYVCVDATASRGQLDKETALRRMDSQGVTLTTVEATLFEWCETSTAPEFKQISALVRESSPSTSS